MHWRRKWQPTPVPVVRGGGPAGAPGAAGPPPWPRASFIPGGGGSASLPGSVTRVPSEIQPCHLGPPRRSQECHARGSCLGSSLHSQNVPLLGTQPVMKSGPQPGQVSPRQPSARGVGEGWLPRALALLGRPGQPFLRGPPRSTRTDSSAHCALPPLHERRRGPLDDQPLAVPPPCRSASSLSLTLQGRGTQLTSSLSLPTSASLSDAPVLLASPLSPALPFRRHRRRIPGSGATS